MWREFCWNRKPLPEREFFLCWTWNFLQTFSLKTFLGVCAYNKRWYDFWDQECYFCNVFLQFYATIFDAKKGHRPFGPVVTQYYELLDETIRIEQPEIAALQCIKSQLPTRSGSVFKIWSLWQDFKQFSGLRKVFKTQWKIHFPKSGVFEVRNCFAILWRNIANCMMKPHALERARTQLSDA